MEKKRRIILNSTRLIFCSALTAILLTGASARISYAESRSTDLKNFTVIHHGEFNAKDLLVVRRYLQNVRREVGKLFGGFFPKRKITVILTDPKLFMDELTMPETVTGAYDGRIHLPIPWQEKEKSRVQGVLWHEYTHAVIHEMTRGYAPAWINEGMAVYIEAKKRGRLNIRQKEALSTTPVFDITTLEQILKSGVYDENMLTAYKSSFLICNYLHSRYNHKQIGDLFKEIGRAGDWRLALKNVLNLSTEQLSRKAASSYDINL